MRRLLTSVVALSLLVAGCLPLAAPVTANVCDHATIVTSGRLNGTVAVVSTKRSPVGHSTLTLFATIAPTDATQFVWTHELVGIPGSIYSPQLADSATSPRAPPGHLIA